METRKEELFLRERVEYQTVFFAHAILVLPDGKNKILNWNLTLAKHLMKEAESYSRSAKDAFCRLESVKEKAKYQIPTLEYSVNFELLENNVCKVLCKLSAKGEKKLLPPEATFTQLWNILEETLLPKRQAKKYSVKQKSFSKCEKNKKVMQKHPLKAKRLTIIYL